MSAFPRFQGNCPRNVSKDAKYVIRSSSSSGGERSAVVALTYRSEDDERWYMATDKHPELVKMVNAVKTAKGAPPNGAFYINEYKQVIVPMVGSEDYFLAGSYAEPLRFEFEGKILSGEHIDLAGNPLSPGDPWVGPHPGIPYVLCAGGNDIKFTISPRPNVEKDVKLSKAIGPERARAVAAQIGAVKGFLGGRFYVNEFLTIFSPMQADGETRYVYIGQVDLAEWFLPPHGEHL